MMRADEKLEKVEVKKLFFLIDGRRLMVIFSLRLFYQDFDLIKVFISPQSLDKTDYFFYSGCQMILTIKYKAAFTLLSQLPPLQ